VLVDIAAVAAALCPPACWALLARTRLIGAIVAVLLVAAAAVDGYQAAQFAAAIREYCVDPACYEPPLAQVVLLPSRPLRSA
jgi:hypothetical protein